MLRRPRIVHPQIHTPEARLRCPCELRARGGRRDIANATDDLLPFGGGEREQRVSRGVDGGCMASTHHHRVAVPHKLLRHCQTQPTRGPSHHDAQAIAPLLLRL